MHTNVVSVLCYYYLATGPRIAFFVRKGGMTRIYLTGKYLEQIIQFLKAVHVNYFPYFTLHVENAHTVVAVKIVSLQS